MRIGNTYNSLADGNCLFNSLAEILTFHYINVKHRDDPAELEKLLTLIRAILREPRLSEQAIQTAIIGDLAHPSRYPFQSIQRNWAALIRANIAYLYGQGFENLPRKIKNHIAARVFQVADELLCHNFNCCQAPLSVSADLKVFAPHLCRVFSDQMEAITKAYNAQKEKNEETLYQVLIDQAIFVPWIPYDRYFNTGSQSSDQYNRYKPLQDFTGVDPKKIVYRAGALEYRLNNQLMNKFIDLYKNYVGKKCVDVSNDELQVLLEAYAVDEKFNPDDRSKSDLNEFEFKEEAKFFPPLLQFESDNECEAEDTNLLRLTPEKFNAVKAAICHEGNHFTVRVNDEIQQSYSELCARFKVFQSVMKQKKLLQSHITSFVRHQTGKSSSFKDSLDQLDQLMQGWLFTGRFSAKETAQLREIMTGVGAALLAPPAKQDFPAPPAGYSHPTYSLLDRFEGVLGLVLLGGLVTASIYHMPFMLLNIGMSNMLFILGGGVLLAGTAAYLIGQGLFSSTAVSTASSPPTNLTAVSTVSSVPVSSIASCFDLLERAIKPLIV